MVGAKIEVENGQKYYMILRFKSATGSYEVNWN